MAIPQRKPDRVIHCCHRGSRYTSLSFGTYCARLGVWLSMSSHDDANAEAMAHSFVTSLGYELPDWHSFRSNAEARQTPYNWNWIEGWYNAGRR